MIRPLLPADVERARDVTFAALRNLDLRTGQSPLSLTPEIASRGSLRIAHLLATDPDGCWVADVDGKVVGCSLALRRDGMWFLSLLMVHPASQGQGVGRRLLEAALTTATDRSWLLSTVDPAALRRYQRAGFALHPSYAAKGPVDRSRLASARGVTEAEYGDHLDLLDRVSSKVRGASVLQEVPFFQQVGNRLLVADDGYAVIREGGIVALAATDEDTARRLLRACIGEAGEQVEVDWLCAQQQWAIDECLDAGLVLRGGASICLRGQQAMSPYLPSGAFG